VIDAYVARLDLWALGFGKAIPKEVGGQPMDRRILLRFYLYGYFQCIRSSRRLEVKCQQYRGYPGLNAMPCR